jgi:hypothetical protein
VTQYSFRYPVKRKGGNDGLGGNEHLQRIKNPPLVTCTQLANYLKKGSTRETDGINQQLIAAWDFVHIDLIIPM